MKPGGEITRVVLMVLVIALLLAGSFWTLLPFLGGLIWAATVVIATWPLLLRVRARTGKRQWLATVFMTGVILLVLILPFAMAVSTLLDVLHSGPEFLGEYFKNGLGPAPEWLGKIPAVGDKLVAKWTELAAGGREGLIEAARPLRRDCGAVGSRRHRRHRHDDGQHPAHRAAGRHPVFAG